MEAYINLMDRHLKSNFEKYERTTWILLQVKELCNLQL